MKKSEQAEGSAELSNEVMTCRAFRHEDKKHITDRVTTGTTGEVVEFTRIMQCRTCKTIISTTFEVPSFRVKSRNYDRSKVRGKYSVKGGLSVFDARSEYINRLYQS